MAMNPKLLRPKASGGSPFSPLAFSSLQVWLNGATSSSMTLNDGNVSSWADQSSNGNNATQSVAMYQPAFVANSANGLGSVVFDGSDDFLDVQISQLAGQGAHCVGWVFASLGLGTNDGYSPTISVLTNGGADYGALHYLKSDGSAASYPYYDDGSIPYDGSGVYAADNLYVITFRRAAGNPFAVFADGVQEGNGSNPFQEVGIPAIGYKLAAQQNPDRISNIRLCELVVLFDPLAGEEEKLEGYLAHKWGLQANLPALHPYKDAAP